MKALLANGAKVDHAGNDGTTPLFMSSQNGHHEVTKALLANGAEVDLATKAGVTPLSVTAARRPPP